MSSPIFEETIKKAVDDGIVSGVVMLGRGLAGNNESLR